MSTIKYQLKRNEWVNHDRSTLKIQRLLGKRSIEDTHCEKKDNYSAIVHPIWMMNTLLDIN